MYDNEEFQSAISPLPSNTKVKNEPFLLDKGDPLISLDNENDKKQQQIWQEYTWNDAADYMIAKEKKELEEQIKLARSRIDAFHSAKKDQKRKRDEAPIAHAQNTYTEPISNDNNIPVAPRTYDRRYIPKSPKGLPKGIRFVHEETIMKENRNTQIEWHWGATGTGKTYDCYKLYEEARRNGTINEWFVWHHTWKGITPNVKYILMDDVYSNNLSALKFIELIGRKPFDIKRNIPFCADKIYITSIREPMEMFRESHTSYLKRQLRGDEKKNVGTSTQLIQTMYEVQKRLDEGTVIHHTMIMEEGWQDRLEKCKRQGSAMQYTYVKRTCVYQDRPQQPPRAYKMT